MKKLLFLMLLSLTTLVSHAYTGLAVLSPDGKTLTFYESPDYYGNPGEHSGEGKVYSIDHTGVEKGWCKECANVERVILAEDFGIIRADHLFSGFKNLKQISGNARIELKNLFNSDFTETSIDSMFYGCDNLGAVNIDSIIKPVLPIATSKKAFEGCDKLNCVTMTCLDPKKITNVSDMFKDCKSLKTIYVADDFKLTDANTGCTAAFQGCESLVGGNGTTYPASSSNYVFCVDGNMSGSTKMQGYLTENSERKVSVVRTEDQKTLSFYYDHLDHSSEGTVYDLNAYDPTKEQNQQEAPAWNNAQMYTFYPATKVVFDPSFSDVRPTSTRRWFMGHDKLTDIQGLEYLQTINTVDMSYMFAGCSALSSLDVSYMRTDNCRFMYQLFCQLRNQEIDLSNFNTEKVEDMTQMFFSSSIRKINLNCLNTKNVKSMISLFNNCRSLYEIKMDSINTESLTNMTYMFKECTKLKRIDLSTLNLKNVMAFTSTFSGCTALEEVNLKGVTWENVSYTNGMFENDEILKRVFVSYNPDPTKIVRQEDMFKKCYSLVGGMGTVFDENHIGTEYACLDGGEDNPGYFSPIEQRMYIDETGYATYCNVLDLDFSKDENYKAYTVSGFNKKKNQCRLSLAGEVPGGTGLVIKGNPGIYVVQKTTANNILCNMLSGVTKEVTIAATEGTNTNLTLGNGDEGMAFYALSSSTTMPAGSAYLTLPTESMAGAKAITLKFDDEETTGINGVNDDCAADNSIYNLAGQKVDDKYKGIVIRNGKKVMMK